MTSIENDKKIVNLSLIGMAASICLMIFVGGPIGLLGWETAFKVTGLSSKFLFLLSFESLVVNLIAIFSKLRNQSSKWVIFVLYVYAALGVIVVITL